MQVFLVDYLHRVIDARELVGRFQPAQKAGRGHTGSISNASGGGETEAWQGVGRHVASQPTPSTLAPAARRGWLLGTPEPGTPSRAGAEC